MGMRELPIRYRLILTLLDNLRHEIEAVLDARRDLLEKLVLVGFADCVIPQPEHHVLGVRHRLDAAHVHGAHLFDHAEDVGKLSQHLVGFFLVDRDAREARRTLDVIAC
jgi:hypothetical protein